MLKQLPTPSRPRSEVPSRGGFALPELVHGPLRFVARVAVTLLHNADELVLRPVKLLEVIVRELAPLNLRVTLQLLPLALNDVAVHVHTPRAPRARIVPGDS